MIECACLSESGPLSRNSACGAHIHGVFRSIELQDLEELPMALQRNAARPRWQREALEVPFWGCDKACHRIARSLWPPYSGLGLCLSLARLSKGPLEEPSNPNGALAEGEDLREHGGGSSLRDCSCPDDKSVLPLRVLRSAHTHSLQSQGGVQ